MTRKFTLEHRKKLSIAHMGLKTALGYKHTKEAKKKMSKKGKDNGRWKGGRVIDSLGYVRIHMPNHPLSNIRRYVFEHRLVMEKHLGRYLKPKEVVHHINNNKQDNHINNLKLFSNNSDHQKFHGNTAQP